MKNILFVSILSVLMPVLASAGGWVSGSNGGTGFGAWSITNYGFPEAVAYMASNDNVDIKSGKRAWGTAGSNDTFSYSGTEAVRGITGGIGAGDTFSIDIDNGEQVAVPGSFNDGGFGLSLKDAAGGERLAFFAYTSVPNSYYFTDGSGNQQSIGIITTGFNLSISLTGADTYSATITPIGGSGTTINGNLMAGGGIDTLRLWQYNLISGAAGENDSYFNNMGVVPEPTSMIVLGAGLLAFARRRRKA